MAEYYKIDSSILTQTKECRDNFSCLFGMKDCLCKVAIGCKSNTDAVFFKLQDKKDCNYIMSFGYGWICNCPTRKALCREYNI